MAKTCGSQEEIQPVNDHTDFGYWYNEMNSDDQFVRYMTEIYKKQHLNIYMNKQQNTTMTHHTRSNTQSPLNRQQVTRQLPQLMDHPITFDHIQEIHHRHHHHNQISKTSTIERVTRSSPSSTNHQVSSTPRRPLEESGSENQYQRQIKKSRPHEITPSAPPQLSTTVKPFHLPTAHLKRAVANNLPCFYIKFDSNITQRSIPSAMRVARWIRQTVQQQSSESIGDFSILIPVGTNRYKFGVTSKSDFLLLWNCKWPNEMDDIGVEIQRPRSLPDCCALVVRYAPVVDLSNEFVFREISKSISSVSSFSKINYHRPRSTNDYRFCVADANEYEEILKIGRIAIGHLLLPITAFLPGLKLTYCANCWITGHTKPECKMNPRCRKCLDNWEFNHRCQKPMLCAQCEGPHLSTSIEFPVVYNYRITLKDQVKKAINDGLISQPSINQKREANRYVEDERFEKKQINGTKQAWGRQSKSTDRPQIQHENENDRLGELVCRTKDVLDIIRRMELQMDNQVVKVDILEKRSVWNKESLIDLAKIIQQLINATLEKKNKQQLQSLVQQLEAFKENVSEKFNAITNDQQKQTPTSPSFRTQQ
ncbi:unnamed protein product [Rotaria socialis]|uniref:Uncharacterized protein n=1 Tax=Rotaria socialis TaxID=392032 RepID=A0A821E3L8_9BILA|nr:unnamed protein product [Rotaria socialis]CAF4630659.1 unnamed protein product [Rotaria socialis]